MESSQAEITQQNQQRYLMSGVVDFSTAQALLRQSEALFSAAGNSENKTLVMDLSQVQECNSSVLALMLEMAENARQQAIEIHFENLPTVVFTIAKAYGVENEIREICQ